MARLVDSPPWERSPRWGRHTVGDQRQTAPKAARRRRDPMSLRTATILSLATFVLVAFGCLGGPKVRIGHAHASDSASALRRRNCEYLARRTRGLRPDPRVLFGRVVRDVAAPDVGQGHEVHRAVGTMLISSPGVQSSRSQSVVSVVNRMARALFVLRMDRFAIVMFARADSSVRVMPRRSRISPRWHTMRWSSGDAVGVAASDDTDGVLSKAGPDSECQHQTAGHDTDREQCHGEVWGCEPYPA